MHRRGSRALYRDLPVLVLDEATSALDNITEAALLKELRAAWPRKTIIMVSHCMASVRDCDDIWSMDDGKVVAHGAYDKIISREPYLRSLVEKAEVDGGIAVEPAQAAGGRIRPVGRLRCLGL